MTEPAKVKSPAKAKPKSKPATKAVAKPKPVKKTAGKGKAKPKRASMRGEAQKLAAKQLAAGGSKQQEEGANSKYRPEYAAHMLAYFDVQAGKAETNFKTGTTTWVFKDWPTFQGFAKEIGVSKETLHLWATEMNPDGKTLRRPEFSDAYARARETQEHLLMQGGMSGAYNAGFASLAAKNILGWKDKVETDGTLKVAEVDPAMLDAIYNQKVAESAALNSTRGR